MNHIGNPGGQGVGRCLCMGESRTSLGLRPIFHRYVVSSSNLRSPCPALTLVAGKTRPGDVCLSHSQLSAYRRLLISLVKVASPLQHLGLINLIKTTARLSVIVTLISSDLEFLHLLPDSVSGGIEGSSLASPTSTKIGTT